MLKIKSNGKTSITVFSFTSISFSITSYC